MRNKVKKHGWSWILGAALAGLLCARCAQTVQHVSEEAAHRKSDAQAAQDDGVKVFPNVFRAHY